MDLILRGATVVDGTGSPSATVDVGVEDGRISAVGEIAAGDAAGAEVVELDGLVLAPGFIDVHTHYDAQVLWDPDLSPSSWHGVTSVALGNCGFGLAPTRPEHRATIMRTLEKVEGMSVEALEAGIRWDFETFPEYVALLEQAPVRLNVGAFVGHTPLRLYVLGDEASERAATDDEQREMQRLVAEALDAGALGFATSMSPTHNGAGGKPVPSRLADLEEVVTLCDPLRQSNRGVIQAAPGPGLFIKEFGELSQRLGRPVTWSGIMTGVGGRSAVESLERQEAAGGEVFAQIACRPIVMQVTLAEPFPFAVVPAFKPILEMPESERRARYADPAWRAEARNGCDGTWVGRWDRITVQESEQHHDIRNGPTLAQLAAERGVDPFDLMVDLSLAEDLATRFRIVLANDDEDELAELLQDRRALLALSDAGAHASQLCDACYSTYLLEYWVRERGVLSLEEAVWRLTGHAAQALQLPDRGRIAPGFAADLVAFDAATVAAGELERVWDLPAGADRLIAHSRGIDSVWINGQAIRRDGSDLPAARPGRLLRSATR